MDDNFELALRIAFASFVKWSIMVVQVRMFPAWFRMSKNEYRFHLWNNIAKPRILIEFLNSALDSEYTEKSTLIQISRGNIRNMQAQIAVLRRMLRLELFIMEGPILPTHHW